MSPMRNFSRGSRKMSRLSLTWGELCLKSVLFWGFVCQFCIVRRCMCRWVCPEDIAQTSSRLSYWSEIQFIITIISFQCEHLVPMFLLDSQRVVCNLILRKVSEFLRFFYASPRSAFQLFYLLLLGLSFCPWAEIGGEKCDRNDGIR